MFKATIDADILKSSIETFCTVDEARFRISQRPLLGQWIRQTWPWPSFELAASAFTDFAADDCEIAWTLPRSMIFSG